MLLRFAPRAKLYNALLLVSVLLLAAINHIFSRDALTASTVAPDARDGRTFPLDKAEAYARMGIYYTIVLVAVMLTILYFCRERPTVADEASPEA